MNAIPMLNSILQRISAQRGRALLVGGCVRDRLLGIPSKDIDVEVYRFTSHQLCEVLREFGRVDAVGKSFGVLKLRSPQGEQFDFSIPRRDNKVGQGYRGFQVELDPTMTVREACARRDFTINAICFDPLTDEFVDPFDGRGDLARRLLRPCSEAFKEDPLRVLRGMQFASRFGMTATGDCLAMCRQVRHEYATLARERVWIEWQKWAEKASRPSSGLELLRLSDWLTLYPPLNLLVDCPQDAEFHPEGCVWNHTLHVCDSMAAICDRQGIHGEDRVTLMLAALCHDLGKPATTERIDGRWRTPGHCELGREITGPFLTAMACPERIIERVLPLVGEHLVHLGTAPTPRSVRRLALRLHPATLRELAILIEADQDGRPPLPGGLPEAMQCILEIGRQASVAESKPKSLLLGRHLITLGVAPGPAMGEILEAAFEAQLDGQFATVEDGVEWARSHIGAQGKSV